jgi:hypothetical protein
MVSAMNRACGRGTVENLLENFRIASHTGCSPYFAERVSAAIRLQDKCRVAGRRVQILPR